MLGDMDGEMDGLMLTELALAEGLIDPIEDIDGDTAPYEESNASSSDIGSYSPNIGSEDGAGVLGRLE